MANATHTHSSTTPERRRIVMFCGGRGGATIIRALLRDPDVHLTLLINAYDDGLSTGALRGFVPGMLGASDFRKNLSRLLEMSSPVQYAVADMLEYRFPDAADATTLQALLRALAAISKGRSPRIAGGPAMPAQLASCVERLDGRVAGTFWSQLRSFEQYARAQEVPFSYADCSLGNLLFAGAFLHNGRSFNAAVAEISRALRCRADVLNVTRGENRILIGLKSDGEILERESRIVGSQSPVPVEALYLLPQMLDRQQLQALAPLAVEDKKQRLSELHRDVEISPEADEALRRADVILFAPGTQHSSLLPSYSTRGVAEAIAQGRATHRVFVVNLRDDYDTQGWDPRALVDRALLALRDPDNTHRTVTHVFAPRGQQWTPVWRGAQVIEDDFENPRLPGVHNGARVADAVRELVNAGGEGDNDRLDIYVDLHQRSIAVESLLQEFFELSWRKCFSGVRLAVNRLPSAPAAQPEGVQVAPARHVGMFSETAALAEWIATSDARFFASITGDGEYRLADILIAVDLLRTRRFGAIQGARNQSKRQFFGSIADAYAGRLPMYVASVAGGFGVSVLCGARLGLILADPLTGFRVYDRLALPAPLRENLLQRPPRTTLEVTRRLVAWGVEIAEVPVSYHHYPGFTDDRWRLARGLVNALSVLR
jgi:2-phospho-L-lactate transferase/gluconeogenesis factor (CofD/UPF0052 family)